MSDRNDDVEYIRWAKKVKIRDSFTCQLCGRRAGILESHHLQGWVGYPDERYDVDNGITLCGAFINHKNGKLIPEKSGCAAHYYFHQLYGKGNNTKWQYYEFAEMYRLLKTIVSKELNIPLDDNVT
jgi:hypothetical protein